MSEQMNTRLHPANTPAQEVFSLAVKTALLTHPRFTTVADLARSLGYHRNTVSRCINRGTMPRVRKDITRLLGLPISK